MAPRTMDREKRSRQIIKHATALFSERGYNATTIDAVAERAGVAKGTVYQYFRSKQELFFGVFDAFTEQYYAALREQVPDSGVTAAEQIRVATNAAFDLAADIEQLFPLTFEFWAASSSLEMRARFTSLFRVMYALFRKFFADIIRRGIEEGEFRDDVEADRLAAVLVGSLDGVFLQAWFDRDLKPAAAGKAFIEVFLRGLGTAGQKGNSHAQA